MRSKERLMEWISSSRSLLFHLYPLFRMAWRVFRVLPLGFGNASLNSVSYLYTSSEKVFLLRLLTENTLAVPRPSLANMLSPLTRHVGSTAYENWCINFLEIQKLVYLPCNYLITIPRALISLIWYRESFFNRSPSFHYSSSNMLN